MQIKEAIEVILGYKRLDEHMNNNERLPACDIAMYQPVVRTTLDGEWDEDELKSDVYDVCTEVMTEATLKKYTNRALKNVKLLLPDYMNETILNSIDDVIELYNTEYDKHRKENKFGIVWYDEAIKKMVLKILKENLVS